MKNKFICIIGIDASGKTTLAKGLVNKLNQKGIRAKHVWGGYECYVLRPLVYIGEKLFLHGSDPFEDYSHYHNTIQKTAENSIISNLYRNLTLIEYLFQIFFKIQIPLLLGKAIVSDRYVYDIIINLAVNLGYSDEELKRHLKRFMRICPKPNLVIFINTPPEVAFKRKNDIPSLKYLELREKFYLSIADEYNVMVLDGNKNLNELEEIITNKVIGDLKI